ncbi:MAG: hypothetical protein PVH05_10200 [Burkholderiales bacterium]|jgi:hypothetical protein
MMRRPAGPKAWVAGLRPVSILRPVAPALLALAGVITLAISHAAGLPEVAASNQRLDSVDHDQFECTGTQTDSECRRRGVAAVQIGGEPVTEMALFYRDGLLVRSVFVFSESRFDPVVANLTAQLGTPRLGTELLKAGMAGVFENRYGVWKRDDQVWFVEQYFERVTSSGLWRMDASEFAAFQAERDRTRVRGARDL